MIGLEVEVKIRVANYVWSDNWSDSFVIPIVLSKHFANVFVEYFFMFKVHSMYCSDICCYWVWATSHVEWVLNSAFGDVTIILLLFQVTAMYIICVLCGHQMLSSQMTTQLPMWIELLLLEQVRDVANVRSLVPPSNVRWVFHTESLKVLFIISYKCPSICLGY